MEKVVITTAVTGTWKEKHIIRTGIYGWAFRLAKAALEKFKCGSILWR